MVVSVQAGAQEELVLAQPACSQGLELGLLGLHPVLLGAQPTGLQALALVLGLGALVRWCW